MATMLMSAPAFAMVHGGDELQVTVYNHPELSEKVIVDGSGSLTLPLAGTIDVQGLEPNQVAKHVEIALAKYVRNPAVDVQVSTQSPSIFVSGGPGGVLKFQPGESLADGLADLGALTSVGAASTTASGHSGIAGLERSRVDLHHVSLNRDGNAIGTYDATNLSATGDGGPRLQPGDTIVLINKPDAVIVRGDVLRPGTAFLTSDETLADAIDQVGGVSATAATSNLKFTRDGVTRLVSLGDPIMNQSADKGDLIVVATAPRVTVVGVVEKPGPVVLKADFSLLSALYGAGGPAKYGDIGRVSVIHDGTSHTYDVAALVRSADAKNDPTLSDGDTVLVPEGRHVDYSGIFGNLSPLFYLLRPF